MSYPIILISERLQKRKAPEQPKIAEPEELSFVFDDASIKKEKHWTVEEVEEMEKNRSRNLYKGKRPKLKERGE
jgi:hypothetical protein